MTIVRGVTFFAAGLLALAVAMPPSAKADEWNQKTKITFSGAVEIPGQVLPPGTYVFKLVDLLGDRHVVQVFDQTEKHLYGTILAIPDYHLKPHGKTIVTFEERAAGAPPAVKAWFYPGENFGHEFVYPKVRAVELAQTNQTTVPSVAEQTTETNQQTLAQAPLMAQQPNQQETTVAEAFTPPPAQPAAAPPPPPAPEPPAAPEALPHTASPLPLIGLIGLASLALAGTLRIAASRL